MFSEDYSLVMFLHPSDKLLKQDCKLPYILHFSSSSKDQSLPCGQKTLHQNLLIDETLYFGQTYKRQLPKIHLSFHRIDFYLLPMNQKFFLDKTDNPIYQ